MPAAAIYRCYLVILAVSCKERQANHVCLPLCVDNTTVNEIYLSTRRAEA